MAGDDGVEDTEGGVEDESEMQRTALNSTIRTADPHNQIILISALTREIPTVSATLLLFFKKTAFVHFLFCCKIGIPGARPNKWRQNILQTWPDSDRFCTKIFGPDNISKWT